MPDNDEPRILESSYRESPAEEPSFPWEVIAPVVLYTGAAYVAFAAVYDTDLPELVAAAVCALSLTWRLYAWDSAGRAVHITERTQRLAEQRVESRPWIPSPGNPNRTRIGKWSFTDSEWRRLATAMTPGQTLTRDDVQFLERDNGDKLFTNPTRQWRDREIQSELQRLGWIDEGGTVTGNHLEDLTERGIAPPRQSG